MIQLGTNYTHFAPITDLSKQQGVVYTYHLNRTLAQDQLGKMRQNGLTAIKVQLYHWAVDDPQPFRPPYGNYGYVVPLQPNGCMDDQRMLNLQNHLADIKAAGFSTVQISFDPAGTLLDPTHWPDGPVGDRYEREAAFITNVRPMVRALGIPYGFDLGAWITGDFNENCTQYATSLWTWYTAAFGNADAKLSGGASKAAIRNLANVYKGLWQDGPVNWSRLEYDLHVYGAESEDGWGSAYSVVSGWLDTLAEMGAPSDIPVSIAESFSFRDFTTWEQICRAMKDHPEWTWTSFYSWPMLLTYLSRDDEFSAAPPVEGMAPWLVSQYLTSSP